MKQTIPATVDVLLVGMGPVGAAAANLLGRYGIRTLAIDKSSDIFMAPRAIALDNEALRILQLAGLEEGDFATHAIAKVQMRSPLFGNYARANTAGHIDGHPRLVTFYQPELERALRARLAGYPHVQVALGTELIDFNEQEQGVQARLRLADGSIHGVRASYLVGVDGASSFVRRHAGMDFHGKTFAQDWLVVDAQDVPDPIDHIEFMCDPRRPTPHMVAPGGRQRWEFMLRPDETREQMERPEKIRELLQPWCRPEDITIERTAVYRFHARVVERFSRGRIFLAGDAAHITPPFVGQGLVAGLRDVANLCWKLAWVVQGRAAPAILDSYDMERRPHAKSIVNLALLMGRLVMPRNRLTALGVHGLMSLLQLLPATRALFQDLKIKPPSRFGRGLFKACGRGARLVRGGLFPQGLVRRGAGQPFVLSDDALGQRLALVGFGCDPKSALAPGLQAAWAQAGGTTLQLRHRGQVDTGGEPSWEDMSDSLVPGAAPVGWLAVVRPDRTVLHDGPLAQADAIVSEALALLGVARPAPGGQAAQLRASRTG
ncbi:bifunctional 3-(3-hydroxy-phenyl)propionate/3-hydroxycinnamic acid hydroxylase [Duganella sp. LX20W]|uniref:Bifunctional 3-(3-hydroxy-phenyl)propionate/3-hydroxycinnamic acid hydroxylase n=1 Tax=Rugamonas brunnea TaxID=2758569 RepID=A0A7W2IDC6_9BURK|nr:bifunctional 3-(3-hydroxy-phenyl)propionate/3-hydroxycinnamic acid hydroxylase [Rugamonas brunnea]MBA5639135.1 bifunctional 3-(3-hydroxy-phenyl)propionate/3-hydroxycinnamic acid hydroxylase [Rugamonas brunnea]